MCWRSMWKIPVPNLILEESVLGRMFIEMTDKTPGEVYQAVEANSLGLSEAEPLPTREEAMERCWREICCFWWTGTIRD